MDKQHQYILRLDLGWEVSFWLVSNAHDEQHAKMIFIETMLLLSKKAFRAEQITDVELVNEVVQHIHSDYYGG